MVKTRKRVPELPKAQLGSSMVWVSSRPRASGLRSDRVGVVMVILRFSGSDWMSGSVSDADSCAGADVAGVRRAGDVGAAASPRAGSVGPAGPGRAAAQALVTCSP